jgi:hypothetical protein
VYFDVKKVNADALEWGGIYRLAKHCYYRVAKSARKGEQGAADTALAAEKDALRRELERLRGEGE